MDMIFGDVVLNNSASMLFQISLIKITNAHCHVTKENRLAVFCDLYKMELQIIWKWLVLR